jgi:hypothetical protein
MWLNAIVTAINLGIIAGFLEGPIRSCYRL